MNDELRLAIESTLADRLGENPKIESFSSVAGGCISEACVIRLTDDRNMFVKSNRQLPDAMFSCEADGLKAIARTKTIRVPSVISVGKTTSGTRFLVMEYIPPGPVNSDRSDRFGHQLAQLHLHSKSTADENRRYGWDHDNFLGPTRQPNRWAVDWGEFWTHRRIEFQLKLAIDNGYRDSLPVWQGHFLKRIQTLVSSGDSRISLIHGDLWHGNFLLDQQGQPVLVDPAVYYAHREAEFGMITLFGGFDARFFEAYQELIPHTDGWEDRVEIYRLYHLLNHLNLFGAGYLAGCVDIIKKYC